MQSYIARAFSPQVAPGASEPTGLAQLPLLLTQQRVLLGMEELVISFETRSKHPLALNTLYLGVTPIVFAQSDYNALFHLVGVDREAFTRLIGQIPSIDPTHKVASDPFNLLCIWLIHLAHHVIKNETAKKSFQKNVALYLHYRFFTSLVNNFFKHRAVEGVMAATINSLTNKFDILKEGTWRRSLELRALELISEQSIHYRTLLRPEDDQKFLYVLSDTQTRLRSRIKKIANVYYDAHRNGESIDTKSSTTEIEGTKVFVQQTSTFDAVISSLTAEVMNQHLFVDRGDVEKIAHQFPVPLQMLLSALTQMSQLAQAQHAEGKLDVKEPHQLEDGTRIELVVGMRALVADIVHSSFRYCLLNHVPLTNKLAVYIKARNVYSSSRLNDPNIARVKESVGHYIDGIGKTTRELTRSSLRLAIIMYILYRALKKL